MYRKFNFRKLRYSFQTRLYFLGLALFHSRQPNLNGGKNVPVFSIVKHSEIGATNVKYWNMVMVDWVAPLNVEGGGIYVVSLGCC